MSAYDLLVIEDFGLMELDMDKCRDLFEIIETRDAYSGAAEPPVRRGESHVSGPDGATLLN